MRTLAKFFLNNLYGKDKRGFIYADTDSIHCDLPPEKLQVNLNQNPSSDNSFVDETQTTNKLIDVCNSICENYKFYYDVKYCKYEKYYNIKLVSMENNLLVVRHKFLYGIVNHFDESMLYNAIERILKTQIIEYYMT